MRKQLIDRYLRHTRISRIESMTTGGKIPDLHIRSHTLDWFAELKHVEGIFNAHRPVINTPWRPGQLTWLSNHASYGGNVALVLTIGDMWYIVQEIGNILLFYHNLIHLKQCSNYYGHIHNLPVDIWEKRE